MTPTTSHRPNRNQTNQDEDMSDPDQLFRINIAWMPDGDFEPEWIETTRGGYFSEWGSNEDELQQMIEAGAAILLPIQEEPTLLSDLRKLAGELEALRLENRKAMNEALWQGSYSSAYYNEGKASAFGLTVAKLSAVIEKHGGEG